MRTSDLHSAHLIIKVNILPIVKLNTQANLYPNYKMHVITFRSTVNGQPDISFNKHNSKVFGGWRGEYNVSGFSKSFQGEIIKLRLTKIKECGKLDILKSHTWALNIYEINDVEKGTPMFPHLQAIQIMKGRQRICCRQMNGQNVADETEIEYVLDVPIQLSMGRYILGILRKSWDMAEKCSERRSIRTLLNGKVLWFQIKHVS